LDLPPLRLAEVDVRRAVEVRVADDLRAPVFEREPEVLAREVVPDLRDDDVERFAVERFAVVRLVVERFAVERDDADLPREVVPDLPAAVVLFARVVVPDLRAAVLLFARVAVVPDLRAAVVLFARDVVPDLRDDAVELFARVDAPLLREDVDDDLLRDDDAFDFDFVSPAAARCLFTVLAAISFARFGERP